MGCLHVSKTIDLPILFIIWSKRCTVTFNCKFPNWKRTMRLKRCHYYLWLFLLAFRAYFEESFRRSHPEVSVRKVVDSHFAKYRAFCLILQEFCDFCDLGFILFDSSNESVKSNENLVFIDIFSFPKVKSWSYNIVII